MGILSAISGGFNVGAQVYGNALSREAEQREREQAQLRLMGERQGDTQENMRLKAELAASRAGAGKGGAGGRSMEDTAALATSANYDEFRAAAGGSTVANEQAARAIRRGDAGVSDADMGPGPAGKDGKESYRPGQASDLLKKSRNSLFAAMGLADPGHADDLQKSLSQEQTRKNTDDYRAGDDRAGSAALVGQGKGAFSNDGTNEVTGKVAPGSVGEAKRADLFASANSHTAKANDIKDGGASSIRDELKAVDGKRKSLDTNLRAAQTIVNGGNFIMLPSAEQQAAKANVARLQGKKDDLDDQYDELSKRIRGASAPAPAPAAAADKAKPTVAPSDPTKRAIGTIYDNGNGRLGKWTAKGWEAI